MKTMYKAQNLLVYRVSDEGEIQFRDTTMELGWKRSEFLTLKAQKLGLPAQEILDKEARRQGWIAVKEAPQKDSAVPEEAAAEETSTKSNAVQLAGILVERQKRHGGEMTAQAFKEGLRTGGCGRSEGFIDYDSKGVSIRPDGELEMKFTWAKFVKFCKENGLIEENPTAAAGTAPQSAPIASDAQSSPCPSSDADVPTEEKTPLNSHCKTGKSPSGHCGAAACCNEPYDCCAQCPNDCNSRCGWISEKEEPAQCNTKPVLNMAAAANTETPAVLPQGKISTTSESEEDAEASTPKPLPPDAPTNLSAPASPADAGAATQSLSAAAPASLEAPAAFDYSSLDARTADDLHFAEREYMQGVNLAKMGYRRMADAVALAHNALCGSCDKLSQLKHGNRGEETFGAWCTSIGINRKAAERLLNVAALFENSSPQQQKVLETLGPSLLYAAARPSANEEAREMVKDGKVVSLKEFQALEAQLKAKEQELADVRQEAALDRKEQEDANAAALRYKNEADRRAEDQQRLEGRVRILQDALNQSAQESKEKDARIAELEARPVEVVGVDPDEIQRRAEKLAEEKTRELRSDMDQLVQEHDSTVDALNAAGQQQDALTLARVLDAVNACEDLLRRQFEGLRHADYDRVYVPATDMMEDLCSKISQAILDGEWPREEAEE